MSANKPAGGAHTPGPTPMGLLSRCQQNLTDIINEDGKCHIAVYSKNGESRDFVIRACNAHEQLVEALRDLLRDEKLDDDDPKLIATRARANLALSSASKGGGK